MADLPKVVVWPYNFSSKLKSKESDINDYVVITGINRTILATKLYHYPNDCCLSYFIFEAKNIKTILHIFYLLGGFLNVNVSEVSFDEIHQLFSKDLDIEPGGHWRPKDCKPRWKVR